MDRDRGVSGLEVESHEAYRVLRGEGGTAVILTCEHASARLPDGYGWGGDTWAIGTHWSYDIGAAELTEELSRHMGCPAVLSRVSRLLVDVNREETSPTLFLEEAEGRPIGLNAHVDPEERRHRLERFHHPYHQAVRRVARSVEGALLCGVHTFTPVFDGKARTLEIGVLFDDDEGPAVQLAEALGRSGFSVRLNEPYSGRDGLIYSPQTHARALGRTALELEVRQDLAGSAPWRRRLVRALAEALEGVSSR